MKQPSRDVAHTNTAEAPMAATPASTDATGNRALSRRRFVTLVAASSAALLAAPASAAERSRRKTSSTPSPKPAPPMPAAAPALSKIEKEFARQRAGTLATLKQLRDYPLPPGGDLPVVFRPQRTRVKGGR